MMRVSICIPTYRQVEFLRKTLHSILAQDYSEYEIVVTDAACRGSHGGRDFNDAIS
jgi:glycosyltransferase involved in cell wall biosynthesis